MNSCWTGQQFTGVDAELWRKRLHRLVYKDQFTADLARCSAEELNGEGMMAWQHTNSGNTICTSAKSWGQ